MYTSLIPSTATISPLDPTFLINHSRLDQDTDEAMLDSYATVATELVENYLSRYLLNRTVTWTVSEDQTSHFLNLALVPWQWSLYTNRPVMELPRPTSSVTSVTLGIWGTTDQVLIQGTDYQLDTGSQFGRIRWISNTFMNPLHDHLQVVFTSGYGVGNIPTPILHAITLMTTNLYEYRGDQMPDIWTPAVEALLAPYRLVYFG